MRVWLSASAVRVCSSASASVFESGASVFESSVSMFESSASVFESSVSVLKLDYMLRIYRQNSNNFSLKVRAKSTSWFPSYKELHALVEKFQVQIGSKKSKISLTTISSSVKR